jgi:hypothetical protein
MKCYFHEQFTKDSGFHLPCPLLLSLVHSDGSQLLCCDLPCGEAHMARNWEKSSVKNHLEIDSWSSNPWGTESYQHHLSELRSRFSLDGGLRWLQPYITWDPEPADPAEPSQIPAHRGYEIINSCCFKLQTLGSNLLHTKTVINLLNY